MADKNQAPDQAPDQQQPERQPVPAEQQPEQAEVTLGDTVPQESLTTDDAKNSERAQRAAEETGVTERFLGPGAAGDPENPGERGDAPAALTAAAAADNEAGQGDTGAPRRPF